MKKKVLLVSGWAADEDTWNNVIEDIEDDFLFKKILWSECLDRKNNRLFNELEKVQEPVTVIGSSLGGLLALQAVIEYSSKCSELIMICSTSRMIKDEHYVGVDPKIIGAMKFGLNLNRKGLLRDFAAKLFSPDPNTEDIEKFLKVTEKFSTKELTKGLDILLNTDLRHKLREVPVKVLNIHGSRDSIMPIEQSEYLHKHLPNGTLEIIEGSGHNMLVTHAKQVAQKIKRFIGNG
ncbi:MAG: alpha/beta hydrolase [Candidatus Omnitrophica bacterium]|nr:alpha/beta hydrolase [Candidatus Omnitrophota bacterium]